MRIMVSVNSMVDRAISPRTTAFSRNSSPRCFGPGFQNENIAVRSTASANATACSIRSLPSKVASHLEKAQITGNDVVHTAAIIRQT